MKDRVEPGAITGCEVNYQNWKSAFSISNGSAQLVVLTEVGPRILFYGFCSGQNEFYEIPEQSGPGDGKLFKVYGGHRLWVSPEVARTYYPDNLPVQTRRLDGGWVFTAPPEFENPGTNLQKEIEIKLAPAGTRVTITHRIRNLGDKATKLAPWAISVMAGGGKAILPLPPRGPFSTSRLLPEGVMTLWCYTDLADPRWSLGTTYIQLHQERNPTGRFKEQMGGIFNRNGWGAYFRNGHLFVKKAEVKTRVKYPDFGCNFEVFTDTQSLELETLGPLQNVKPGESVEHVEKWWLFKNVEAGHDENWIDSVIVPLVESVE